MKKQISVETIAAGLFLSIAFLWSLNQGHELTWKVLTFVACLGAGALVYKVLEAYNRATPICAIGGVLTVWAFLTFFEVI